MNTTTTPLSLTASTSDTMFSRLKAHLDKHRYTKGTYVDDAPLDQYRRGKTKWRVLISHDHIGTYMAVRCHSTDVVKVYQYRPDEAVLDFNGWRTQDTYACVRLGLSVAGVSYAHIGPRTVCSLSQVVYRYYQADGWSAVLFYDGTVIDKKGVPVTPLCPFKAQRANRRVRAEVLARLKESGFETMLPLLYANRDSGHPTVHWADCQAALDPDRADEWQALAIYVWYKLRIKYRWAIDGEDKVNDHKEALKFIKNKLTKDLTETVTTDRLYA